MAQSSVTSHRDSGHSVHGLGSRIRRCSLPADAASPAPLRSTGFYRHEIGEWSPVHAFGDLAGDAVRVLEDGALPIAEYCPAGSAQERIDLEVALHVAADLGDPPLGAGWELCLQARKAAYPPTVAVPEVAIDEDGEPSAGEN